MESGPPLNLSTTVKVEELPASVVDSNEQYTVEGELVDDEEETQNRSQGADVSIVLNWPLSGWGWQIWKWL